MKIGINGLGNIGTTLALLLNDYKQLLGIDEVVCFKNFSQPWTMVDLDFLTIKGIKIMSSANYSFADFLADIDFVFDATSNGNGLKNKPIYQQTTHLKGAIAQGSEKGFGQPFISGIAESLTSEPFVHIQSCNTHGAASILQLVSGHQLEQLDQADFVVVRRSEDLSHHERLVTSNVVARHLSPITGTHHAIDVRDMFKSININCNITSSDITTPSQLLHSTRFNIRLNKPFSHDKFEHKLKANPFIATTKKFDSNLIFELGRRYGKYGRIYNHAILVHENILIDEYTIKGWAFIPQEGNTIISTIEAFIKMIALPNAAQQIDIIKQDLLIPQW